MDDASERAIEEDMLDQFNYFDDEDEELTDRREPAALDAFDLVDEGPDEASVDYRTPIPREWIVSRFEPACEPKVGDYPLSYC